MVAVTLKRAAIGFLVGMVVGALIVIALGFASQGGSLALPPTLLTLTGSEAGALLAQMLASGAYGAIPMAGVSFYELDSWGLLKQAVVHYATYTVAFVLIGICVGWIEPTMIDVGLMAGIFAVCHSMIWFIMYTRYKAEVGELNALLQKSKQGA